MRLADYLRFGWAGVKAHKKRALTVVIIVGLLFGVIAAGAFVLQGLENAVLAEMLVPTDGKVLVMSQVETQICGDNCDIKSEVEQIKKNIARYGGEVIDAEVSQTADGMFYKLAEQVFADIADDVDDDATQVAVPLVTAADLAGLELPEHDVSLAKKLAAIKDVRKQVLYETVESETSERYYVAEILPGGVYAGSLTLGSVGQDKNPLDLLLRQIETGVSQDFILVAKTDGVDAAEMGLVLARFESVVAAYNYYSDPANYCADNNRFFGTCGRDYRYQVVAAIADPLTVYEKFADIWLVYKVAAVVLVVIALIITLSTYARLIGRDLKIISLYHAAGATGWQIRMVYVVYLLMLSVLAVGFALVLGLVLAAVLSVVNATALTQVFVLGFGAAEQTIWLIGWNDLIWYMIGAMVFAALAAVMLGNGNFGSKELARKLK